MAERVIHIIFRRDPFTPDLRFVEVETEDGKSIAVGEWLHDAPDYLVLRLVVSDD